MGWEKDKAVKWNMKGQMSCAYKFNRTSRIFTQNSLEKAEGRASSTSYPRRDR